TVPRSTCSPPFPYTTLFRSEDGVDLDRHRKPERDARAGGPAVDREQHGEQAREQGEDLVVEAAHQMDDRERGRASHPDGGARVDAGAAGEREDRKSTRLNSSHV